MNLNELANNLEHEYADLMSQLVRHRAANYTREEISERTGYPVEALAELEAYWSNPPMDMIRRYAHAMHFMISYNVELVEIEMDNGL